MDAMNTEATNQEGLAMHLHTAQSTILVNLTDAEGHVTGRAVPVSVGYMQSITHDYGEDADGRRGTPMIEYDLLDVSLDTTTLRTLSIQQAEQVLAEARAIFFQRNARTARH